MSVALMSAKQLGIRLAVGRPPLFRGVNLDVAAGEVVGIVGPNGVGKTTLLNVVSLLVRPSMGTLQILGQSVRWKRHGPERKPSIFLEPVHLSRSFQKVPAVQGVKMWQYVYWSAICESGDLRKMTHLLRAMFVEPFSPLFSSRYRERLRNNETATRGLLHELGLPADCASTYVDALSMGMRRIADVLRALETASQFFVLDEPFANLRPSVVAALSNRIRRRVADGAGGVITDHNQSAVRDVVDRLYLLSESGLVDLAC